MDLYNGESVHSPRPVTMIESTLLLQATIEEVQAAAMIGQKHPVGVMISIAAGS